MRGQISEVVKKEQGEEGAQARTAYTGGRFLGAGKRNTHPHAHKSTHEHTHAHTSTHEHTRAHVSTHTQAHMSTHRAELANSTCSRHRMSSRLSTGLPLVSRSPDQWAEHPPCLSSHRYHARSGEAK